MSDDQDELRKKLEGGDSNDMSSEMFDEPIEIKEPDRKATIQVTISADLAEEIVGQLGDYFKDFYPVDWVKIEITS